MNARGRLGLAFTRAAAAPTAWTLAALAGIGSLLTTAQALAISGVHPGPAALARIWAGLLPEVLVITLPIAVLFGVASTARGWRDSGELQALSAAGAPTRVLAPPVLIFGLLLGAALYCCTHIAAPAGRRLARAQLLSSLSDIHLQAGQPVVLADVLLQAGDVQAGDPVDLIVASGDLVVRAPSGRFTHGATLELDHGTALRLPVGQTTPEWTVTFDRARVPLSPPPPRTDPPDMADGSLRRRIARMNADGRRPLLERSTLYKRDAIPAAVPLLALLALPLGARGARPAIAAAGTALAWWAVMRMCDQALGALGPPLAVAIPPLLLCVATAGAWLTWRDR